MGLQLLDIQFQLEKKFDIKISKEELVSLFTERTPPDCSAGELHDFACRKVEATGRQVPVDSWNAVTRILGDSLTVRSRTIRKDSLLVADLGAQ